jgi:hypothetical protein
VRRKLRVLSAVIAVFCIAAWVLLGANRGWTKTTRTRMEKDPVTEIEFPKVEKHFDPGVECLAVGLLVSILLASGSFLIRRGPG